MNVKYIKNNPVLGIDYDYDLIRKEYRKLNCPKSVYNPCKIPIENNTYHFLLSERSTGKTTNLILFGMIMNRIYRTEIQYIRQSEEMIMNKQISSLMNTIQEYGYISKITNNEYSSCIYKSRKWFYCNIDDNGKILNQSSEPFMSCLSVDRSEYYKSAYNAPLGDFIIFDEFIGKRYKMNEFLYFMDLLSTIRRNRMNVKIFMLANTIDLYSEYFNDFEISHIVQNMNCNDAINIKTDLGTPIYIEWIKDLKNNTDKKKSNTLFFGFKNKQLGSIVGGNWTTNNFPHITKDYKIILRGIYLEYINNLLALEIVQYDDIGIGLNVHMAYKTYSDSIIYTLGNLNDSRYRYHFSLNDNLDILIQKLVKEHRIFFQNNNCGTMFFNFMNKKGFK